MIAFPYHISGVYIINNLSNGKAYIGSSINVRKRAKEHVRKLERGIHLNKTLQSDWSASEGIGFEVCMLEEVPDIDQLNIREQYWIDKKETFNKLKGYNIYRKACRTHGSKRSIENREKMSSLTSEEIRDIKLLWRDTDLSMEYIGSMFNCVKGAISNIVTNVNCDWVQIDERDILDKEKYADKIKKYKRGSKKLSSIEVLEIKYLLSKNLKPNSISKLYNVSGSNISSIKNGKTFQHVKLEENDRDFTYLDKYITHDNLSKSLPESEIKDIEWILVNFENVKYKSIKNKYGISDQYIKKLKQNGLKKEKIENRGMSKDILLGIEFKPRKLTELEVNQILKDLKKIEMTSKMIADKYSTTVDIVKNIKRGSYNFIE